MRKISIEIEIELIRLMMLLPGIRYLIIMALLLVLIQFLASVLKSWNRLSIVWHVGLITRWSMCGLRTLVWWNGRC